MLDWLTRLSRPRDMSCTTAAAAAMVIFVCLHVIPRPVSGNEVLQVDEADDGGW